MKAMKRGSALLLALILVLSLPLTAFADEAKNTITISNPTSGYEYEAYQIFKGDLSEGVLSNVEWGTGVNAAEKVNEKTLLEALKADETPIGKAEDDSDILFGSLFANCKNAAGVAEALSNKAEIVAQTFAKIVGDYLGTASGTSEEDTTAKNYTISGLADGYYLVKNSKVPTGAAAYTRYILKVVEDVTVKPKGDAPTLDKKIDENGNKVSYNNAAIGDTVHYELTSKVPDMTGYNKYFFIVNDTLSKGLTFVEDSVVVKIGDQTLEEGTDFTVSSAAVTDKDGTETGETAVEIIFKDFIQYKAFAGKEITITYSATVNEKAVIGTVGNPNTADLIFSNDPNHEYKGESDENPDKPGRDEPTGETPKSETITYVTEVEIDKVDGKGNRLTGAEFEITGEKLNKVIVSTDTFTENANGTYYLLKDGSYTTTAPVTTGGEDDTSDKYASTTTKYTKTTNSKTITTSETVKATATVGPDGTLKFTGLAAGDYEIKEIKAPDGYNMLKDPIKLTIGWEKPDDTDKKCTWTYSWELGNDTFNKVPIEVINQAGSHLPETGGMGTTLFYVLGALLTLGAGVVLVAKRRMNAQK